MVRCLGQFDKESSGNEFTLVIQKSSDAELQKDDVIPTLKIRILHICPKLHCPIDCMCGKWQLEDESDHKHQFDTCTELINYYGKNIIVGKSTSHTSLGKPIRIIDVTKLLDKEIKSAVCAKVEIEYLFLLSILSIFLNILDYQFHST